MHDDSPTSVSPLKDEPPPPAARIATGNRWASPDWWLVILGALSILIGVSAAVFLASRMDGFGRDPGGDLFLIGYFAFILTFAAGAILMGPFVVWMLLAQDRKDIRWHVRGALARERREQRLQQVPPPAPSRREADGEEGLVEKPS